MRKTISGPRFQEPERASRTRLGILFGGRSGEYEVSLSSAASVIAALDPREFEISAIGITKSGKIAGRDEIRRMLPRHVHGRLAGFGAGKTKDPYSGWLSWLRRDSADSGPDIIFPLLHGPYGEDGTIQGMLETVGIPYIGCGVLASAVGMDKDVMKRLFRQAGLPVVPHMVVATREIDARLTSIRKAVRKELGYPLFSKPANLGSSVGVVKIHAERELPDAVRYAAQFDRKIIIEKGIDARELECSILGNDDPESSAVGEVIPAHEFYDYESKYHDPASRLEIPARISDDQAATIRDLSRKAFAAIDGTGLARVDFLMDRTTGQIWLNEINTMPGFTPISMYAKLWAAGGLSFENLVRRLIGLGLERHRERMQWRVSPID